jgi:acyl-CoA thioesterase I
LGAFRALETAIARCLCRAILLAIAALMCASLAANAAPLRIVAIGASNTHGWYLGNQGAYPAQLQTLLRAKGIDAEVINAGVPFDTTAMMLRRIDKDVPNGTDIAILQPGGNDRRRFFGTKEQRAANIAEMERRLRARGIKVLVYDDDAIAAVPVGSMNCYAVVLDLDLLATARIPHCPAGLQRDPRLRLWRAWMPPLCDLHSVNDDEYIIAVALDYHVGRCLIHVAHPGHLSFRTIRRYHTADPM